MAKEEILKIRCTAELKEQIDRLAKAEKRTTSDYIRLAMEEKAEESFYTKEDIEKMGTDENGKNAVLRWAVINAPCENEGDEFIQLFSTLDDAVEAAKGELAADAANVIKQYKTNGGKREIEVALIPCNEDGRKCSPWFENADGKVQCNYTPIQLF